MVFPRCAGAGGAAAGGAAAGGRLAWLACLGGPAAAEPPACGWGPGEGLLGPAAGAAGAPAAPVGCWPPASAAGGASEDERRWALPFGAVVPATSDLAPELWARVRSPWDGLRTERAGAPAATAATAAGPELVPAGAPGGSTKPDADVPVLPLPPGTAPCPGPAPPLLLVLLPWAEAVRDREDGRGRDRGRWGAGCSGPVAGTTACAAAAAPARMTPCSSTSPGCSASSMGGMGGPAASSAMASATALAAAASASAMMSTSTSARGGAGGGMLAGAAAGAGLGSVGTCAAAVATGGGVALPGPGSSGKGDTPSRAAAAALMTIPPSDAPWVSGVVEEPLAVVLLAPGATLLGRAVERAVGGREPAPDCTAAAAALRAAAAAVRLLALLPPALGPDWDGLWAVVPASCCVAGRVGDWEVRGQRLTVEGVPQRQPNLRLRAHT